MKGKKEKKAVRQKKSTAGKGIKEPAPRQREIGTPIAMQNFLLGTDIKLKISASYNDWKNLQFYINEVVPWKVSTGNRLPNFLGSDLLASFINPAVWGSKEEKANPGPGPHGSQLPKKDHDKGGSDPFTRNMQVLSALLHIFFSYWFKRSPTDRPELLRGLELPDDFKYELQGGEIINLPSFYTAYCMEYVFGRIRNTWRIMPFYENDDEAKSFRATYIRKGMKILRKTVDKESLDAVYASLEECNFAACYIGKKCPNMFELIRSLPRAFLSLYSFYSDFHFFSQNNPIVKALEATLPKFERYEDRRRRLGLD